VLRVVFLVQLMTFTYTMKFNYDIIYTAKWARLQILWWKSLVFREASATCISTAMSTSYYSIKVCLKNGYHFIKLYVLMHLCPISTNHNQPHPAAPVIEYPIKESMLHSTGCRITFTCCLFLYIIKYVIQKLKRDALLYRNIWKYIKILDWKRFTKTTLPKLFFHQNDHILECFLDYPATTGHDVLKMRSDNPK